MNLKANNSLKLRIGVITTLYLVFSICIGITTYAEEISPDRVVAERLITKINFLLLIKESTKVSPDSKRVAYLSGLGNKRFVFVVDGKEEKQYDTIGRPLFFSPDSKRVAYVAQSGKKWFVVVDGTEGKQYDGIGVGTLIISPDSERVAYNAQTGNKWFFVVDGIEGKQYDGPTGTPIFSPDSKRVAYGARIGNKRFLVVDGNEGKQYNSVVIPGGGRVVFESTDSLYYLALKMYYPKD